MQGDKLIIDLQGLLLGIDTCVIAGIVEMESIPFLPGQKGFVSGIISLRGEPVAVAGLSAAFEASSPVAGRAPHKVIIARQSGRTLGLDADGGVLSFLWNEEIKSGRKTAKKENSFRYVEEVVETARGDVSIIDWRLIFEDTARILSTHGAGI